MKLINVGFGNIVSGSRVIAIVSPDSAPIKRIIQEAKERGMVMTQPAEDALGQLLLLTATTLSYRLYKQKLSPEGQNRNPVMKTLKTAVMTMNKRGLLIVVSGPSGVGKGTVLKKLLADNSDIVPSISATTRAPRNGDIEGKTYFFKSVDEFKKMIDNNEFMEWAVYNDNYYGTPVKYVNEKLDEGKDVLLEIDVQGALNLQEKYPSAVYIFIAPENIDVLRERLIGRNTETPEEIEDRINAAKWELTKKDKYDYVVVNKIVEDASDEILSILNKRRD